MMRTVWILAAMVAACPALVAAGPLSPGDSYSYEITSDGGEVLRPTVLFTSPYEQGDDAGRLVRRDADGNRVFDKGWNFAPHNGEFPARGTMRLGAAWTTEMEVWRDGEARIRQSRACEVTERGNVSAAGFVFPGALKVECAWSLPGQEPFRNDATWYWADAQGYNILLLAEQEGDNIGLLRVKLVAINSQTFSTDR